MKTKMLGFICFMACNAVGIWKFGFCGMLLALACWTGAAVYFMDFDLDDEEIDPEPEHDSCNGCLHHLGGGCCSINCESECREGGGFELWRDKELWREDDEHR